MKQLFPIEIQENTIQSLYNKRNSKTKIIYLFILIILICIFTSLPFIYVDISAQSRGYIRTPNDNNPLQAAISGEIVQINVHENKKVSKGDTLVCLRMDELIERIAHNRQKLNENIEFIKDLSLLLVGREDVYTSKYKKERDQYKAKIREREIASIQAEKEYLVSKHLYNKGVESKFVFEQIESNYRSEESQMLLLQQQQWNTWQAEITRLESANIDLQSEYNQLEKQRKEYWIIAPIDGYIIQYTGLKEGNFITPSQTIASITSIDSLIVECYVTPNDIGYISKGQNVKIQVDTYNYQQWGLANGEVKDIISDVIQINNMPFFRVRCSLDRDYLELPNGYRGILKKGMTLTARFYLTKRSLSQLLFDKVDDWMNPKIKKDGNKN